MATSIINNTVTYNSLINITAKTLSDKLANSGVPKKVFRNNTANFTIGENVTCGEDNSKVDQKKDVTLTETESIQAYTPPTVVQITSDIKSFMTSLGFPVTTEVPTSDSLISFMFALNWFIDKAVMQRAVESNTDIVYHLHYKAPLASSYSKIPYSNELADTITTSKIENIYKQISTTNILSDNVRVATLSSSAHTSSSSSSSCSSSSFIAYFNLN